MQSDRPGYLLERPTDRRLIRKVVLVVLACLAAGTLLALAVL